MTACYEQVLISFMPSYITGRPISQLIEAAVKRDGTFVCSLCGKTYRSRGSFRHHLETHEGKTACPHCGLKFATISSRNRHAANCFGRDNSPDLP